MFNALRRLTCTAGILMTATAAQAQTSPEVVK